MGRWVLLVLVVGLAGCGSGPSYALIEVDRVARTVIEHGDPIEVLGKGFPLGKSGTLTLDGTAHRPGAEPRQVSLSLPVKVHSETRLSARPDQAFFSALGGRATWRGRYIIKFDAFGGGEVLGQAEAQLDFVPATRDRMTIGQAPDAAATAAANHFGVTLPHAQSEGWGLVIASVEPNSKAAQLGLRTGDRIVSVDGVRLLAREDFVPSPHSRRSSLVVERLGDTELVTVMTSFPTQRQKPLLLAIVALVAMMIGWLLPLASALERAWQPVKRGRRHILGVALNIAAAVALVALVIRQDLQTDIETVGLFLVLSLLPLAIEARRFGFARDRLLWAWVSLLGLGAAAYFTHAQSLTAAVAAQGASPLSFAALADPTLFVLALSVVASAGAVARRVVGFRCASVFAFVVSCMCATLLFGGWAAPSGHAPLGVMAFGAKVAALQFAGVRLRVYRRQLAWAALLAFGFGLLARGLGVSAMVALIGPTFVSALTVTVALLIAQRVLSVRLPRPLQKPS